MCSTQRHLQLGDGAPWRYAAHAGKRAESAADGASFDDAVTIRRGTRDPLGPKLYVRTRGTITV